MKMCLEFGSDSEDPVCIHTRQQGLIKFIEVTNTLIRICMHAF